MEKEQRDLFGLVVSLRHVGSRLEKRPNRGEALVYAEGIFAPTVMWGANGREIWGIGFGG